MQARFGVETAGVAGGGECGEEVVEPVAGDFAEDGCDDGDEVEVACGVGSVR